MNRSVFGWKRRLAVVAMLAVVAAACGDDDDSATTSSPSSSSVAAGSDEDGGTGSSDSNDVTTSSVVASGPADTGESDGTVSDDPAGVTSSTVASGMDDTGDAGLTVSDNPDEGVTASTIKIGWLGDLTGPTASTQKAHLEGAQAYFEFVNANGGVLGRQLEMISYDDAYVVDNTLINYRRLVDDDKILAFLGLNNSSGIEALSPEIEQRKVPIIGSQSGSDTTAKNPYFWNTIATYSDMAGVVEARLAELLGGSDKIKAIPVGLTVASGDQWIAAVRSVVEERGGTLTEPVRIDASAEDMSAEARKIKELVDDGANAIMLHGTTRPFIVFFKGLSEAGVTETPIGGMTGLVQPEVYIQSPADIIDQAWGTHTLTPAEIETPGNVEMLDFVEQQGKWDDSVKAIGFVQGWVNGKVLVEALERAAESGELSRASLQEALGTIDGFDTGDQSPPIDFTRPGHNGGAVVRPYEWDNDHLVPVGEFTDWEAFVG